MRLLICLCLLACAPKQPVQSATPEQPGQQTGAPVTPVPDDSPGAAGVTHPALRDLLHRHWEATMERWPTWATSLGDHRFDEPLVRPVARRSPRVAGAAGRLPGRVKALARDELNPDDLVTVRLFEESLSRDLDGAVCRSHLWAISRAATPTAP